jgi:hypothetical protein
MIIRDACIVLWTLWGVGMMVLGIYIALSIWKNK